MSIIYGDVTYYSYELFTHFNNKQSKVLLFLIIVSKIGHDIFKLLPQKHHIYFTRSRV